MTITTSYSIIQTHFFPGALFAEEGFEEERDELCRVDEAAVVKLVHVAAKHGEEGGGGGRGVGRRRRTRLKIATSGA